MRLHNNKDSTKVLFTSQLQTEQFHTPLSLLLIILIFCVYLHPVSCVLNSTSITGLSILDWPIGFIWRLLRLWTMLIIEYPTVTVKVEQQWMFCSFTLICVYVEYCIVVHAYLNTYPFLLKFCWFALDDIHISSQGPGDWMS
jgi:hypothetical protein